MRLGIIANRTKDDAEKVLRKLKVHAKRMGIDVSEKPGKDDDFIVVLGGDGSVLRAVHQMGRSQVPFVNINVGSLGFLTCTDVAGMDDALRCLLEGRYTLDPRFVLKGTVFRDNGKKATVTMSALNDIVAMRGHSGRVVGLDLIVNDEEVTTFLCDGLIVATPTGSTAYSLSSNGPIVLPRTQAFIVNTICPHTLTSRPLVLPNSLTIKIRVSSHDSPLLLVCDGQIKTTLKHGDYVQIENADHKVNLVMLPGHSHFTALSQKLGWSGTAIKK